MKMRYIVGILVVLVLCCCGVAFAESMDKIESVQATAEDAVMGDEAAEDSLMPADEAGSAEELYAPESEPVKAVATPKA